MWRPICGSSGHFRCRPEIQSLARDPLRGPKTPHVGGVICECFIPTSIPAIGKAWERPVCQDPECVAWWVGRRAMWLFLVAFPWGGLFTLPSLASCFGCHRK